MGDKKKLAIMKTDKIKLTKSVSLMFNSTPNKPSVFCMGMFL